MLINVCVPSPFDSGEKGKRLSLSRLSVGARRNQLYGRTAGHSPSFTEKYFLVSRTLLAKRQNSRVLHHDWLEVGHLMITTLNGVIPFIHTKMMLHLSGGT